ncbi:uncharacterized protein LOC106050949 [Biomphalaria glabrata]|uniref:Uncharacterized protein LOC106050949 n=2 Tax=Biomphalaria glabrata TaxID=6526 RepID=A0A9U8DU64_BIOGL|nr:uncharacterized protein LOC106050949 [Biomphalaria glabrata]
MDFVRPNTEALYGGHISGRRLRGVKVNPIFQENEGSRDACDTQSEGGVPVGEIQIEMYESLPRHRSVRHTLSAPVVVIGQTRSTGVLPDHSDPVKNGNNTRHKSETENSLKNRGSRKQKKQLSRQRRYEASSDDPDVIELADSSLPSSSNSSPSSSFYSSERSNKDTGWSRGNRPFSQRYYLSTLSERTVSADSTAADQSTQAVCDEEDSGLSSYGQSQTEHIYNNNNNAFYISETLGQPTVHSLDLMNNNEMSMPDQMLQHYNAESLRMSRLRAEVLRNENYVEEFSRNPNTLRPEDFILCDTLSLRAVFSLSSSSSIDSDYKNLESKLANKIHCQCNGRPTLKCECGRAALQKLFREKRDGLQNGSMEDNLQTLDAGQLLKNQVNLNDASSPCLQPAKGSQKKLLALHALGHAEGKFVTFSDDTIFNEDNRVTYVKECITRSAFQLHLDDKEAGYDNNGFLTDDEKALQLKDKNSSNKLNSQGSIVLSVSSLNAPAYLHAYLMGFHQETKTPEGTPSEEKRAAPVSIEAIGGITTDDPAFDTIGEATEEDFEYYRRRRRKKKSCGNSEDGSVEAWTKRTSRCRKIKISVIVVTVIIGIVVAIALAIHFGAPAAGNSSLTSEQTQEPGSSFSRILF